MTARTRELTGIPNLTLLLGKAALTGLGRGGGDLPSTVYSLDGLAVDPERLAAYHRVCGLRQTGELPGTYPHVLGFPLQVKLMTDGDFPFPLVGSVHLANRITQHRPIGLGERLGLRVHAEHLREHPKGKQFDVITEAVVAGDVVWRGTSTYLRRGGGSGAERSGDRERAVPRPKAVWRVPADTGRRYAEVSGDHNPIHLYPVTAKLFGYPRAIAHGMWTKARCLAAFEGRLPDAYTVDVRFKLPVLLPAEVGFTARRDGGTHRFQLFGKRSGKPHLDGEITPA